MRGVLLPFLAFSLAGVVACTSESESPRPVADQLATALSQGELPDSVTDDGEAGQSYDEVVGGLSSTDGTAVTVEVTDVSQADRSAEANLRWTWEIADQEPWTYETTAALQLTGDGDAAAWTVQWSPSLVEPTLQPGEALTLSRLAPDRGDILGARGARLVTERRVLRYGLDKTLVRPRQVRGSAQRIARAVGVAAGPYVARARAAGDRAFVEAIVLRKPEERRVDAAYEEIPGAITLPDTVPLAIERDFAAPILGKVGPVTAELVEESEGRLEPGDTAGLSGLQARYDAQLTGEPGVRIEAEAEDGTRRTLHEVPAVDGEPLRTTLDPGLQRKAERILSAVGASGSGDGPAGGPASAIVAVRPASGAIVAAANGPGNGGQNLATFGQYAPGSTFKVVSALALLRAGLDRDSRVRCSPQVSVTGKPFANYDDYPTAAVGLITLREAFAQSCNTAFIRGRTRLDRGDLADAAQSLGLGEDFDVGFPAYFGQVPTPTSPTEAAAAMIGQGRVLVSPLVMAAVAASVQSGGTVVPHLLPDLAEPEPETPLGPGEARTLRALMRAVVTDGPAGFLRDLPGQVGAKTGTAEYGEPVRGRLRTHAWMIAARQDLAVAVFVETGESGSRTAGPALRRFLR